MDDIKADETLDLRGFICPVPLFKTRKVIDKLSFGQILEVLGTDPGIRYDLPIWARRSGHDFLGEEEGKEFSRYFVRKGNSAKGCTE